MLSNQKSREVHLRSRPLGLPQVSDFEIVERPVPTPTPDQVLVRNLYMTVDPYMRGRMDDRQSYVPPFQIGEVLSGGAIGQVVSAPGDSPFRSGDAVQSNNGWREWFVSDGSDLQPVNTTLGPAQSHLGALGLPGLTAYVGLLHVGALKEGERVFVSAASGAVGAVVCQIAKAKGCYVVGSVGSDEKARYLTDELGIDRAINYRAVGDLSQAVAEAFPQGIDVYFENVGGAHLEAALGAMRPFGRLPLCGMIGEYNAASPLLGPRNIRLAVALRLTLKGFIVSDHLSLMGDFERDMAAWITAGKMKWRETIVDGVERAPEAFIGLFKGENIGKMLVRLGEAD